VEDPVGRGPSAGLNGKKRGVGEGGPGPPPLSAPSLPCQMRKIRGGEGGLGPPLWESRIPPLYKHGPHTAAYDAKGAEGGGGGSSPP